VNLDLGPLLMTEVSSSLADEVVRARTNKQEIEQINNNINNLVVQNGQDFTRLEEQIKNKVADANKTENQENKYILLREAEQLIKKQNELKESSKRLLQLQDSVNLVAKASPTAGKIDQLDQVAKQFDKLYREGKEDEALAFLEENKDLIRNALNDNSTELKQNLVDRVVKLEDELSGLSKRIDAYNREIKELELEIQALENSRYSVKKKELEALEAKIASKKEEIEMIRAERIKLEGKSDVISTEKYFLNKQIEVLETALTNPTLAKVSREEANRSLLETSKTNTNTLTNYVQQQIAELEKKDPTLRDRITVTSGMKGDNIMAEHRTLKQRVDDTPGLSKQERLNRLLNTTTSTKKALEQRLKDVEAQLEKNKFDEKLIKEKQQIIRDLEQLEREIEMYQQELGSSQPSDVASIDTEKIQEDIDPDYKTNYEEIESDINLSEEERLSKQQVLDQDLVQEIEKKIESNNQRILADPGNQELKKNQQALNLLKEQKQKAIVEREKVINTSSTPTKVAFTRDEVIKNADPAYVERFNAINNDRTKPEVQRFNELQKIDKQLVTRMNERIAQLEKQVKNNPQDKNAVAELDALRTAVLETEKVIDERSALIESLESGNVQLTAQEILSQLAPAYETKIFEIKNNRSISEKERLERLNTEDEDLISKIDRQIADKQALLKTNPQDTKVQQELKTLLELRSDKSKDVEQRKTQIDLLNARGKEVASIEALDPEYNDRIKEIESNRSLSQKEKLEKIQQEDKQLVNRINEEVEKIEESGTSNDPEKEKQLEQLRTLKSTTEQAIETRDEQIEKAGTQTLSTEQIIAQLDPDYTDDLKDIQLNTKLSDSEKLGKTQLRDKELLSLIEKELVQVDQKLKADPSNPELINRKEQLTDVKMSVESRIEERNQLIESQATSELTAEQLEAEKRTVLKEIDASYDKKKATLLAGTDNVSYSDLITWKRSY
jgi:dTDP-4-amino-4,6-dideoxygalactose transaminase